MWYRLLLSPADAVLLLLPSTPRPVVTIGARLVLVRVLVVVVVMAVCCDRSKIVRARRWRWRWRWSVVHQSSALGRVWWGRRSRDGRSVVAAARACPVGGMWIIIVVIVGVGSLPVRVVLAIAVTTTRHDMSTGARLAATIAVAVSIALAIAANTLGHGRWWAVMGIMGIRGRSHRLGSKGNWGCSRQQDRQM